jgi:VWFA-related protein
MLPPLRFCLAFLPCFVPLAGQGQAVPAATPAPAQVAPAPAENGTVLAQPPGIKAGSAVSSGSTISLDVVVTDRAGKPVSGLALSDFTVLDNNQPDKILTFHAYDETARQSEPPVEAIILFDTVNTGFDVVSYTRQQVENFLRRDGGRLPLPISILWMTNDGVDVQSEPSRDGNALATQLDAAEGRLRSITRSAGEYGAIERFQFSARMFYGIAQRELDKPGRKLLIWASPGWPLLDAPNIDISNKGQQSLFGQIVELSALLREAHITVYSISEGMSGPDTFLFQSFVKGVKKANQTRIPDVNLKVLAVQSGGLVLPPTNDLTGPLGTCLQDADAYYSLSFEPPPADGPNQYHELKVRVDKPGLTARTRTGYYDQPAQQAAP